MLNRPTLKREKRVERQSVAEANQLEKGLEAALRQSEASLGREIENLINSRYRPLYQQTDQNA